MELQEFNEPEQAEHSRKGDRGVLVLGFIVVVTMAALVATSVAGTPNMGSPIPIVSTPTAPTTSSTEIPYFPAQFYAQPQPEEPAVPVASF
jgi:hypothetical protein